MSKDLNNLKGTTNGDVMSGDSPVPPGEPGWWIVMKVALLIAVPLVLLFLIKMVVE